MVKSVVSVPMKLDLARFAQDVIDASVEAGVTYREVDEMLGVQVAYSITGNNPDYLPTMRNYLAVCNLLDLDPRKYFVLGL